MPNVAAHVMTIKLGTFDQGRRIADHRTVDPGGDPGMSGPRRPSHPYGSSDLRIMRAWMEAELALAGRRHDDRCASLRAAADEARRCDCSRHDLVVAAVESAVQQADVVDPRRVLGKHYYRIPAEVRPLLGQRNGAGLKLLLGQFVKYERWEQQALASAVLRGRKTNPETGWVEGLAGLTEQETRAYWKRISGWSRLEIARELTAPDLLHDRARWTSLKTVSNLCWLAKVKVLTAFGLPPSGDPGEEWPDEAAAEA